MEMDLSDFLNKIKDLKPELYISQKEKVVIKSVKLLKKNQNFFEPNHLYIARVSSLPKSLSFSSPVNILCITNSPLPSKYKKCPMLNLIVLNNNMDIFTAFNEVQEIIVKHQQLAINSAKLLDSLVSGKGIEHIVNVAYELLGNPICILDLSFRLIASSKNVNVEDPIWIELLTKGYCSYDFVPMASVHKFIEIVHKSNSPIFMSKDKFRIPRIISNIKVDNKVVGYLAALECEKPFTHDDIELIFLICRVLSSEMQKSKFIQNTKGLRYENFIADLLSGRDMDKTTLDDRLKFLDLHFKQNLYILVISLPQNSFVNTSLHQLRDSVEYMLADSKSVIYKDHIVVIISRSSKISNIEDYFFKLSKFLEKNKVYGGLSHCFNNLAEVKEHYRQSLKSIELGLRLKSNKFLFYYEDLSIYHLLEICSVENNLKEFCHNSIFTLMDYDWKNNTNYMRSLYTYLINEKNQLVTADVLGICRSTLAHRIEKIQKIMDINLNDAITTFRLILTFTILEYLDKAKLVQQVNKKRKLQTYGGNTHE